METFTRAKRFISNNLKDTITGQAKFVNLKRACYGLKQSARCWYKRFVDFLKKLGFTSSSADPCLFIRKRGENQLYIALYVDDGLVASTNNIELDDFLKALQTEFKVSHKNLSYFLGLEISQEDNGTIKIDQKSYTRRILKRFGMDNCRAVSTPIIDPSQNRSVPKEDNGFPYRQAVGALMYLMVSTRPDIAFAVGVASRALENPTADDILRVKKYSDT